MNTRPTEFRRASDMRAQAQLDRMLAAQRAADARREATIRALPLPGSRKTDTSRNPLREWIAEQMQIPEGHETLWLLAFSVATLLIGLMALCTP